MTEYTEAHIVSDTNRLAMWSDQLKTAVSLNDAAEAETLMKAIAVVTERLTVNLSPYMEARS